MRFWTTAPVLCAASVALVLIALPDNTKAQFKGNPSKLPPPEVETFTTADGVQLRGLFHKSPKGGQGDPVVILLYPPGVGNSMANEDQEEFTLKLNENGYHVFRFDWRGHGKSTGIVDTEKFWDNTFNPVTGSWNLKYIKNAKKKPLKNELSVKDFDPKYFPVYITDLAAARFQIDKKNDRGDLNSSSIYVIGAGDTASLGMLWLAAEWIRPAALPLVSFGPPYQIVPTIGVKADPAAGQDIAGAVWLSATRPLSVNDTAIKKWVKGALQLRESNSMLFLYGDKEQTAEDSKWFYNDVIKAKGDLMLGVKPLAHTFLTPIANTRMTGFALLGNNTNQKTDDMILNYLTARQKSRGTLIRTVRGYTDPYYIDLQWFGLTP